VPIPWRLLRSDSDLLVKPTPDDLTFLHDLIGRLPMGLRLHFRSRKQAAKIEFLACLDQVFRQLGLGQTRQVGMVSMSRNAIGMNKPISRPLRPSSWCASVAGQAEGVQAAGKCAP
jgi:hypothetical protein